MASCKSNFVDEVYAQFLVCRLCSKPYKHPKVLTCLHTFCCECLEKHYETEEQERPYRFLMYARALSCPICKNKTEVPAGGIGRLPDNFVVEDLGDVVRKRMPTFSDEKFCEICTNEKDSSAGKLAVAKCIDCSKHLCKFCCELHRKTKVTQFHALFDLQIEKDVKCKAHQDEVIKYVCESCDECICIICAFHQHKDHEVSSIAEVLESSKDSFQNMLLDCEKKIEDMTLQIKQIEQYDTSLRRTEDKIRDSTTEIVTLLRQKEREVVSHIKNAIGPKLIDMISQKNILESNLEKLRAAHQLTSAIADTNNIELLVAKKTLKEQMTNILNTCEFKDQDLQFESMYGELNNTDYFKILRKLIVQLSLGKPSIPVWLLVDISDTFTQTDPCPASAEIVSEKLLIKDFIEKEQEQAKIKPDVVPWQKPLPLITVTQNVIPINHIVLKPAIKIITRTKDAATEMVRITFAEKSTATPTVARMDRDTSTAQVQVMHKNVSTTNQATVDKGTCTAPDVRSAYVSMAAVKRQVTVSRGIIATPQLADKQTSTICLERTSRGSSPVLFSTNSNPATNPDEKLQASHESNLTKPVNNKPHGIISSSFSDTNANLVFSPEASKCTAGNAVTSTFVPNNSSPKLAVMPQKNIFVPISVANNKFQAFANSSSSPSINSGNINQPFYVKPLLHTQLSVEGATGNPSPVAANSRIAFLSERLQKNASTNFSVASSSKLAKNLPGPESSANKPNEQ